MVPKFMSPSLTSPQSSRLRDATIYSTFALECLINISIYTWLKQNSWDSPLNNLLYLQSSLAYKWQFHSSNYSGPNPQIYPDSFLSLIPPPPPRQQILLALPLKYTQNSLTSHHLHCYHPNPTHHHVKLDYYNSLLPSFFASVILNTAIQVTLINSKSVYATSLSKVSVASLHSISKAKSLWSLL